MERPILILMILCMGVYVRANSDGGYLFVMFRDEAPPMTEQICGLVSENGRNWTALNNAEPVLISTVGEKGVRDSYLFRSHHNRTFHLVATDLWINLTRHGWSRAQTAASQSIVVWDSEDIVHWSQPCLVKVAPDTAGCTWAPEAIYDAERGDTWYSGFPRCQMTIFARIAFGLPVQKNLRLSVSHLSTSKSRPAEAGRCHDHHGLPRLHSCRAVSLPRYGKHTIRNGWMQQVRIKRLK
ncbi:MAG: hypothetical protein JXB18_15130 [Sedimentisphaerales bacterium]|nr:hypothetical protein [Sedimentisphaerales bacterium]